MQSRVQGNIKNLIIKGHEVNMNLFQRFYMPKREVALEYNISIKSNVQHTIYDLTYIAKLYSKVNISKWLLFIRIHTPDDDYAAALTHLPNIVVFFFACV